MEGITLVQNYHLLFNFIFIVLWASQLKLNALEFTRIVHDYFPQEKVKYSLSS